MPDRTARRPGAEETMDRSELVASLRRAAVPDALYDIPGVHDIQVQPDAYYFLRPESGTWVVGVRERSADSVLGRFATEDEACRDLYTRLSELPAPRPDAAERIAEVLAERDEIQRRAWEAFDRAAPETGDSEPHRPPPG
jgi:hypothetical protein